MGDLTPRHCLTVGRGRGLQEAVGWGVSPELFASDGAGTFTGEENRDSTERKSDLRGSRVSAEKSDVTSPHSGGPFAPAIHLLAHGGTESPCRDSTGAWAPQGCTLAVAAPCY